MADWQRTIRLNPEWAQAKAGSLAMNELARVIAERLKALPPFGVDHLDEERDEIAIEFSEAARDPSITGDDLDEVMRRLYDWADTRLDDKPFGGKRVCWVDTISPASQSAA